MKRARGLAESPPPELLFSSRAGNTTPLHGFSESPPLYRRTNRWHNSPPQSAQSYPEHHHRQHQQGEEEEDYEEDDHEDAIVRNIASFMTLSDAASLASGFLGGDSAAVDAGMTPADSWAIGIELDEDMDLLSSSLWDIATPVTPALVALSPGENDDEENDSQLALDNMEIVLRERRRRWAQEKLTSAIFAHPGSLRSYCVEAYNAAKEIRAQQERQLQCKGDPETMIEPTSSSVSSYNKAAVAVAVAHKHHQRLKLLHDLIDLLFHNVPLSVLLDLIEAMTGITMETTMSAIRLAGKIANAILSSLARFFGAIWDTITNFNPFHLLEAIISMQFNAMGKTSEVLASGIQSVATGVGSASSMALHRWSAANLNGNMSSASMGVHGGTHTQRGSRQMVVNKKLLRKLSTINDAARVVAYHEMEDETGGLTKHAINRTRRMMHYTVSLRPFVATVALQPSEVAARASSSLMDAPEGMAAYRRNPDEYSDWSMEDTDSAGDSSGSPFMCTPQSFPPTPHSRHFVMMQKSRFSEDDVFGARDRLRVHGALASEDERTREMAEALKDNQILAVFDDRDLPSDIELTCGKHVATKIGTMYYSTIRGMIPLLRNCYVYFEITVIPHVGHVPPIAMPTLAIGLSTEEMPPNTLVGAWQGSVGLCTTGQILTAGHWCTPLDPTHSCYTAGSTVGCLVCLDDDSAVETWDGVMITACVTFSVNGRMVQPAVINNAPAHTSAGMPLQSSAKAPPPAAVSVTKMETAMVKPAALPRESHSATGTATSADDDSKPAGKATTTKPELSTTCNGSAAAIKLLVPASEDVFATVTLQSIATSVMCRFSSEDILASTRDMIGAPLDGSPIYALDGSVLDL